MRFPHSADAYDDAGQLAARTVDGKQATLTWNPLGQLDQATIDGQDTSMVYDAAGERLIRRDPDASVTLYLGSTELKLTAGQVTAKRYYSSPDASLIAMRQSSGVTWMLAGLHGSTQLAVNDATGAVSRERYLPFGQRRGGDDLPFTDRGFLGKTEDPSTDLTYLGARYYDPAIAKFISTDPELDLRTPEWANPYSYAANNPIDQSDPDGRRVDTGGGSKDTSYGYSRSKKRPNANQNFAKTHQASGKKKTSRERKIHRDRQKKTEKQRKDIAAWKKREAKRSRHHNRKAAIAKEDIEAYRWTMQNVGLDDEHGMVSSRYPSMRQTLKTRIGGKTRTSTKSGPCSSFVPGTKVLMADGTTKPIEDIKAGDKVIATDPVTGETAAKQVLAPITSKGVKNLVRVTVGSDDEAGILTATGEHPFWVPTIRQWQQASTLWPGQYLRTGSGTYVQISAITARTTADQRVYNLTVADTHTCYVLAGATPVLVHNSDCKWSPTDYNGQRVYQRDDLVDPDRVSSADKYGRSNRKRMTQGLAPMGPDDKPMNLHHMLQTQDGPIAEVTHSMHFGNYNQLHWKAGTKIPSGIDRDAFNAWKSQYWKDRAAGLD